MNNTNDSFIEIWQTTNQEPWVEAILSKRVPGKTRTTKPIVPIGVTVLLHTSKKRWPDWKWLKWSHEVNFSKLHLGHIVGIAKVSNVGLSSELLSAKDYNHWECLDNFSEWNCAAEWTVLFSDVIRLKTPVKARGFQAPYCRAKQETIDAINSNNNGILEEYCDLNRKKNDFSNMRKI